MKGDGGTVNFLFDRVLIFQTYNSYFMMFSFLKLLLNTQSIGKRDKFVIISTLW